MMKAHTPLLAMKACRCSAAYALDKDRAERLERLRELEHRLGLAMRDEERVQQSLLVSSQQQ